MILCSISSEILILQEFASSGCLWYMRKYYTHDILCSAMKHNLVPVNQRNVLGMPHLQNGRQSFLEGFGAEDPYLIQLWNMHLQ
jgi:hypothetical protein